MEPGTIQSTEKLMDFFGQETEEKTPIHNVEQPAQTTTAPATTEPPKPPAPKNPLPAETTAEIVIGSVDFVQQLIFEKIHRRKLKNRLEPFGGIDKAEQLMDDMEAGRKSESELTGDERRMVRLMKDYGRLTKEIAFTDDEIEKAKKPLSQIIKESGFDLPPNMAMFLVATEILGPRLADAITE